MTISSLPFGIQTVHYGEITLDLTPDIYQNLQKKSISIPEFIQFLTRFIAGLESNKKNYNINPYHEKFNRGIHILGKQDAELGVFPESKLVLKCSEGRWYAEDPRRQFFRSVELAWEFKTRLTEQEQALLQICPTYLHMQIHTCNALFKRVLFMPRIEGNPLGNTTIGLSPEFCQTFNIPDVNEIRRQTKFSLHRFLDPDQTRQLLKIQSAVLFHRLSQKGIKIFSLNQKNILARSIGSNRQTQYVIIDPIADYYLPISPIYNLVTSQFCIL